MNNYFSLLKEATEKLIEIHKNKEFTHELLKKAPPVLWFGNNSTKKQKIVTIGANPSREEFLSKNKSKAKKRVQSGQSPKYIKEPLNRFKILSQNQDWTHILEDYTLQNEIIKSFNNYFEENPYRWFGKKTTNNNLAYNVEGFINCVDASYYESDKIYQCLHIDLMSFPTISDFTSILKNQKITYLRMIGQRKFLTS